MENRTLFAFVLAFLVLIGWSLFFGQKQTQAPQKKEAITQEESQELSRSRKAPGLPQPHSPTANITEKKTLTALSAPDVNDIEVDTPLYRAVFTNAGPAIKSFKLKEYYQTKAPDAPLIELVDLEEDMGDILLIQFTDALNANSPSLTYQPDHDRLRLGYESAPRDLVFHTKTPEGLSIYQTFRFYPDRYQIDLNVQVINQSGERIDGAFAARIRALPPQKKKGYYSYVGFALLLNDKLEEVKIKKTSEAKIFEGRIEWVAYENDYFMYAVIPEKLQKGVFKGNLASSGLLKGIHISPTVSLAPEGKISSDYALYLGPRDLMALKELGKNLNKIVNFGWTDIIGKPLLIALRFFYQYLHNYGLSIILLTILIKILFWPLTHKSYKSMKEMQKLQPRMAKIREKYKGDKQKMNQEMMALYKTYKVNPMGGCLPMIIQIPVFFALFRILGSSIELRHAPFMLWINDLSAPDRLFNFPFQIPFMDPPSGIPVLTLLMGASMFIQQKMTPTPGDPSQAKIMMFLPIIFTALFINFPSGLVLYWLVNNLLSIGQQYRIHRKPA